MNKPYKKLILTFIILLIFIHVFSHLNAQTPKIDSLEVLLQQHTQPDTQRVIYLNKIAYELYQLDVSRTFKYAAEAKKLSEQLDYKKGKANSFRILGIYYTLRGDNCKSLDNYQASLKIYKEIGDKTGMSKAYNNIGLIYSQYGYYNKSIEYHQRSLKIDKENNNKKGMSICYTNIGLVYNSMGNYSKAIKYYSKGLEIDRELDDELRLSRSLSGIGVIYAYSNNFTKALKYLNESLEISEKLGLKSTAAESYKELSLMYLKQKKYKDAYRYSKKSLETATEIKETELKRESAKILAQCCDSMGLYKEAYNYYTIFKVMNDSINNAKIYGKVKNLEYKKEKQALELEQQQKEIIRKREEQKQKNARNFYITGFIFMLIIVFVAYRNYLYKRKANIKLAEQKKEIEEANKKLKKLDDFKASVTSMTVHDLKTLLNKIVNTFSCISFFGNKSIDNFRIFSAPSSPIRFLNFINSVLSKGGSC